MPTYDYECSACSFVQEEFHSISSTPEIQCNKCGSKCVKTFTMTENFILKGSGFPSKEIKMKKEMNKKNSKMKTKMNDRERAGEGVTKLSDLKG